MKKSVLVEISAHHVHVSEADLEILFGKIECSAVIVTSGICHLPINIYNLFFKKHNYSCFCKAKALLI